MKRCSWCNLKNPKYVEYHDYEWGIPNFDDHYLFEMLVLESFQAGLSWECILNKRDAFRLAYDNFDLTSVARYDEQKVEDLLQNKNIVRNRLKIKASIRNAKIFQQIQNEFGSFASYLNTFTSGNTIYEVGKTTNELSDRISADLKNRGMTFVGSTIIYAYLQAIGVIFSHDRECDFYKEENEK